MYLVLKKVSVFILFFAIFFLQTQTICFAAESREKEWSGYDKLLHFTCSMGLSILAYRYGRDNTNWSRSQARTAAFFSTMAVCVTKEFIDEEFDWNDIEADLLGAGAGVGMTLRF